MCLIAAYPLWRRVLFGVLVGLVTATVHAQQDRISSRIDSSHMTVLKSRIHPRVRPEDDRGPVDPSLEIAYATLHIKPTAAQQSALEKLLVDQQDPASPEYHRWLTPEQYGDRFGLGRGDIVKITRWLESQGLKVNDVARGRRWLTFSGTADNVARGFRTEIHRYLTDGRPHFANTMPPSVPEALADVIAGVDGLDDYNPTSPVGIPGPQLNFNSGAHGLAPDDIATIYNLKPLYAAGFDGSGQTIAVIGHMAIDLNLIRTYRTRYNLPGTDPKLVLFGPDPGTEAADEPYLDLELVAAVARNASAVYVYAKSGYTAVQYAVDQRLAPIITMSMGTCEPATTPTLRATTQQANAEGITWMASSGDAGAAGCETQGKLPQASKGMAVLMPASIPEVTAVGGTEFDDAGGTYWSGANTSTYGSALSYIPERGWNDVATDWGLAASGGGASIFYAKPPWQTGLGVPNDHARDVPDISVSASWSHDPYYIYAAAGWYGQGGTSAASPVFAGFVAILNQYLVSKGVLSQPGLGNINPTLYRLAQSAPDAFHDVVRGNNIVPCMQGTPDCATGSFGFTAGPGYDLVTGLGTVDLYKLAANWAGGTATVTTVTASPASVAFNGSVKLTATVSPAGVTGEVAFLANDASLGSATLSGSSASLTIGAAQLPAGANTITAVYGGSGSWNGSAGTTAVTVTVPAAASAVVASITPNPVYQVPQTSGGSAWVYTIHLTNESPMAATVTKFTIDGNDDFTNFKNALGSTTIGANQTIAVSLTARNLNPPVNRTFAFAGTDAGGGTWSQQITVPFVARVLEEASLVMITPASVSPNAAADGSCRWAQPLVLEEQGGYDLHLANLVAGSTDFSSQLQQIFGTATLAPFGRLQGTLCWPSSTASGSKSITLTFTETQEQVASARTASVSTTLATAATATVTPAVSPGSVTFSDASAVQKSTVSLSFTGGSPAWTAKVSPANSTTAWLTVSPASGTGAGQLTLTASSAGFANGVYGATLLIQVPAAAAQFISVPVVLIVGGSKAITIGGVTNAASYKTIFAPGMLMTVFGTGLAPATQHAPSVPLPLAMQGVSATVNGYAAPLLDVSPTQLNVQIPYEAGAGPAVLGVNNNGQIGYFVFQVQPAAPGIFMMLDGSSNLVPYAGGQRLQVLPAFITGEGDVAPSLMTGRTPTTSDVTKLPAPGLPVSITVGGVPATVYFAGIPQGLVGVTQINFAIPGDAPLGKQLVVVTVGGSASAPVNLTITQ